MSNETESLTILQPKSGLVPTAQAPTPDIQVTAENADEMAQCQSAIITWTKAKLHQMEFEHADLEGAYRHAVKSKWKSDTLKRHVGIALKRVEFYSKMLVALEHGYQIVPNFPVTAFAVRTDRKKPLKMFTTWWDRDHQQEAAGLPAGEGNYKNPFPVVLERVVVGATETKSAVKNYWADSWADLEFPISMAKPQIMEATTRAMALKIFDDFGILPGAPKQDPMIIARLCIRRSQYNHQWLSFIVAWHLDTRVLP